MTHETVEPPDIVELIFTGPEGEVERLVQMLVEERLIACGQISAGIFSIYRWQGDVERANESRAACHTKADLVDLVIDRLNVEHSYDTPCVIVTPIYAAHAAYHEWVVRETHEP